MLTLRGNRNRPTIMRLTRAASKNTGKYAVFLPSVIALKMRGPQWRLPLGRRGTQGTETRINHDHRSGDAPILERSGGSQYRQSSGADPVAARVCGCRRGPVGASAAALSADGTVRRQRRARLSRAATAGHGLAGSLRGTSGKAVGYGGARARASARRRPRADWRAGRGDGRDARRASRSRSAKCRSALADRAAAGANGRRDR